MCLNDRMLRYYTDPRYLDHEVLPDHPERPDRLRAVNAHLAQTGLAQDLSRGTVPLATLANLSAVHTPEHLAFIERMAPREGLCSIDPDTHMSPGSLSAALLAAGALQQAVTDVLTNQCTRAFCAVRPPGHHAEHGDAMGFCLFNNIAYGAALALQQPGIERVAVLDFDVHHGNGTVDIFRDEPRVLVCSSYQHPFYPNRMTDVQRPHIVHTPLDAGTGSGGFRAAIERDWLPALEQHRADLIFVSAGFDAHQQDPLAQLQLATEDFAWITDLIVSCANSSAEGRIVSALEGGYDLSALTDSVEAHLRVML